MTTQAGNDRQFQKQYQRLSLATRKVHLSAGFPNTVPQKKKVTATMKDAFKLALEIKISGTAWLRTTRLY